MLVTPSGKLPSVESRGDDLNGTAYPAVEPSDAFRSEDTGSGCSSFDAFGGGASGSVAAASRESSGGSGSGSGGSDGGSDRFGGNGGAKLSSADGFGVGTPIAAARGVTLRHDPGPDWLYYGGKWGSTVQARGVQLPAMFCNCAEHYCCHLCASPVSLCRQRRWAAVIDV